MNDDGLRLLVCRSLEHEARSALAALDEVGVEIVVDTAVSPGSTDGPIVLGGPCKGCLAANRGSDALPDLHGRDSCLEMFIGPTRLAAYRAEGVHLLTPGMLRGWREMLGAWGFTRDTARAFFAASASRLVLLDTGTDPGAGGNLDAFAAWVDRPAEVVALPPDHFQLALAARLARARASRAEDVVARLAQSNTDLERFAHIASHDLREPLRTVVSFSKLLEKHLGDDLDDEAAEYLRFVVDAGKRMDALIVDLLSYSRVSTKGRPFELVDCETVLSEVMENLHETIRETSARVTHAPLPPISGDRVQIMELFQNLIGNAIKFRRPDTPPKIHLSARLAGPLAEFTLEDNGIGIAPEFLEQIFVVFRRLHTEEEYTGSGMGLAICKRIVERHGGTITAESTVGVGSTFRFSLGTWGGQD